MALVFGPNQITFDATANIGNDDSANFNFFVGAYSYCINAEPEVAVLKGRKVFENLQIGRFCSLGRNIKFVLARGHNIKNVSTGCVELFLNRGGQPPVIKPFAETQFNQKGTVIIQNDVWIGDDVTIMPDVVIRNGAVVANGSHVVKDVPPYAIVGGNPAKVIGYRFSEEIIEKLQKIQWWYWEPELIRKRGSDFNEDLEAFCEKYLEKSVNYVRKDTGEDNYFVFVDFMETVPNYNEIVQQFLARYVDSPKQLVLFIRNDFDEKISNEVLNNLKAIANYTNTSPMKCKIKIVEGDINCAVEHLLESTHFLTTRCFDVVKFTCICDQVGIEIIPGTDSLIQFR